jgi:hypothetical protein
LSHHLLVLAFIALLAISLTPFSAFSDDKQEPPWGPPTELDTTKNVVQDYTDLSTGTILVQDDAGGTSVVTDDTDGSLFFQILSNLVGIL